MRPSQEDTRFCLPLTFSTVEISVRTGVRWFDHWWPASRSRLPLTLLRRSRTSFRFVAEAYAIYANNAVTGEQCISTQNLKDWEW